MSLAKFRKVGSKNGAGRFVVSEGIAPAAYILPSTALPTLYTDLEDDRFEIVMTKGTILSVVADANGDSRLVPANGTSSNKSHNDGVGSSPETVTVNAKSTPIGVAQYDLYRPFDKGTSQGGGWITHGYVEWPIVDNLNDTVAPGSFVRADDLGRPVVASTPGTDSHLNVAKVVEVEKFATNFDDGLLSYMQLPSDPGALKEVYELTKSGDYQGKLGIRANLDVTDVVGAFRAYLVL